MNFHVANPGVAFNLGFLTGGGGGGGGARLNCSNKTLFFSSLAFITQLYKLYNFSYFGIALNFSVFIFASAKVTLFWWFYYAKFYRADFDRELID